MKLTVLSSSLVLIFALTVASLPAHAEATSFDARPVPVKTPPPIYPSQMRHDGIDGLVTVKVVIDESGNVASCTVNKSTRSEFEEAAVNAVREWKFKPASKDGTPVRSQVIIPVKFSTEAS